MPDETVEPAPEPIAPEPEPIPPEPVEPEDPGVRVGTRDGAPVFVSPVKLQAMYRRNGARAVEAVRRQAARGLTLEVTPEEFDRLFVESRPQ